MKRSPVRIGIYAAMFFLSVHHVLTVYVSSTFLSERLSENAVGLLYAAASIATFFAFILLPRLINRYSNKTVTLVGTLINGAALIGLALNPSLLTVIICFITYTVFVNALNYGLDIFLEEQSADITTGDTRGRFLTISSAAFVIIPMFAGIILASGGFFSIYLGAALILIPFFLIISATPKSKHIVKRRPLRVIARTFFARRDLRNIFFAGFVLQFFYAWMTIYTPLYLAQHLGFDWSHIGLMFSIMLLPFLLFELPLGKLADRYFGEKEIMILGFLCMGIATMALAFAPASFALWAGILFLTRVGASAVEIMTETYFFKKIAAHHTEEIGFYRTARPLSYLTAPLLATLSITLIALFNGPFALTFIILGAISLLGIIPASLLKDTK